MPRTVRTYDDGTSLEFDRGGFDDWCVYVRSADDTRRPPLDTEYFETLVTFGREHGNEAVYQDFVRVYDVTGNDVDDRTLLIIDEVAADYGRESMRMSKTLTTMYMGMIAEENKRNTRLGKRIKRLGTHMLLVEGQTVEDAANFMRGMGWRDIDRMCTERGF